LPNSQDNVFAIRYIDSLVVDIVNLLLLLLLLWLLLSFCFVVAAVIVVVVVVIVIAAFCYCCTRLAETSWGIAEE